MELPSLSGICWFSKFAPTVFRSIVHPVNVRCWTDRRETDTITIFQRELQSIHWILVLYSIMSSVAMFDSGPEVEFTTEIMCSRFHPQTQDLFLAGAISGHLHWWDTMMFVCFLGWFIFVWLFRVRINENEGERTMSIERSMKIHKRSVRAVQFSPDGQSILSVSKDKSIKVRSAETGQIVHKYLEAHEYWICIGSFLMETILLIDSSSPINCLCVVDNCVLATGDDDGTVKVCERRNLHRKILTWTRKSCGIIDKRKR